MSNGSPHPTSDRTGARVIPLQDFTEARAVFADWQGQFDQLSRGRFEGALRVVRGGLVRVVGITANQRVRLRGHDAAGLVSVYPVTEANEGALWQSRRLDPGQLVVHGVTTEADHYSARRTETYGVSLTPAALADAARALLGTVDVAVPHGWAAVAPPPDAVAGLTRRLAQLQKEALADPALLGTPDGRRLEQECVRALVAALYQPAPRRVDLPLSARSLLLRRAEEVMRAHLADPVGAVDLCRALGVSDRTLRLAFCEQYGQGPVAYYKNIRLNAVPARLRTDTPGSIAAAAHEFGFHHLGNFAAHYRRLFGELPSETARRVEERGLPPPHPGPRPA